MAIVGPTNVGKSTLYNQFVQNKSDQAVVGPLPGTITQNQQADAALFTVVDTPGADAVGSVGEEEKNLALSAAANADFLVLVFDAIQGIKKTEQKLFNELSALKKPFVVVLNKIDLIPRKNVQAVISNAALNLGLEPDQIVPIVAKDGKNLGNVGLSCLSGQCGRHYGEVFLRLACDPSSTTGHRYGGCSEIMGCDCRNCSSIRWTAGLMTDLLRYS